MDRRDPDDLANLRAAVAALHADLARLKRRRGVPRRFLPMLLAALLVALVPLATLAVNPFGDLNPGSPHNGNIDAIFNAGITTGCDPGVAYCPNGNVTREEMATFLARTAGLGGNPPVVNAKTAQTAVTAQTVPDGSVTAAKLSPQGSAAGQALVSTGGGVTWGTVAGQAGPQGPQGPTGAPGPQGPQGPGTRTITGYVLNGVSQTGEGYTVTTTNTPGRYVLSFPDGTWQDQPYLFIQPVLPRDVVINTWGYDLSTGSATFLFTFTNGDTEFFFIAVER